VYAPAGVPRHIATDDPLEQIGEHARHHPGPRHRGSPGMSTVIAVTIGGAALLRAAIALAAVAMCRSAQQQGTPRAALPLAPPVPLLRAWSARGDRTAAARPQGHRAPSSIGTALGTLATCCRRPHCRLRDLRPA
jgi:hypothetical protein